MYFLLASHQYLCIRKRILTPHCEHEEIEPATSSSEDGVPFDVCVRSNHISF